MPEQKPHPPIYIAATRTPETLEFAVSTGHPMMTGVVLDHDDATDLCQRFVALSEQAGHSVPFSQIPFFRYCYVAETEVKPRREAEPAMRWTQDMLQWRRQFTEGSEVYHKLDDFRRTRTELSTCKQRFPGSTACWAPNPWRRASSCRRLGTVRVDGRPRNPLMDAFIGSGRWASDRNGPWPRSSPGSLAKVGHHLSGE